MKRSQAPYNLDEVIDACAKHAWERHGDEFILRGVETEAALRQQISRAVEHREARAFSAPYRPDPDKPIPDHSFRREFYDLRPLSETRKELGITVVLNPNRDPETGKLHGGTCVIRLNDRFFRQEMEKEQRYFGVSREALLVVGGYLALREQDRHRQLVVPEVTSNAARNAEDLARGGFSGDAKKARERIDWKRYLSDPTYRAQQRSILVTEQEGQQQDRQPSQQQNRGGREL